MSKLTSSVRRTRNLMRMLTAEAIELIVPLFYAAAYAYLRWVGPNAKWMSGVGVSTFGMEVPTTADFLGSMGAMISIDAFLVTGTLQPSGM